MAITFVAAGANGDNGSVGSGNPTAPGIPAGMAAGDFMLLPVHSTDNVTTSTPAGWTLKQATNAGTGLRQTFFWRRWQAGDAAPTISHTAGDACQARIYGFRGVSTTAADPIEAIATTTATATATVTAASITTVTDGAAVVGAWAEESAGNTSGAPTWASYSGTNPTFAEIGDNGVDNLNANELGVGVAWGICTPGGTVTGTRTAVVTNPGLASPTNVIGTLLALTPAVAAGSAMPLRIPNRFVGPMALRLQLAQRFRQLFGNVAAGATQIVAPNQINSTASVTATVVKTAVLSGTINSKGTVTATVVKTAVLTGTVNSKATVTATVVKTAVLSGTVNSKATVTATIVVTRRIQPTAINGVSTVNGTVVKTAVLIPTVNSKATVTATVVKAGAAATTAFAFNPLVMILASKGVWSVPLRRYPRHRN